MNYDRVQLKQAAKESLRQGHPRPWLVTLVFLLLTGGLSLLVSLLASAPALEQLQLSAYALSILGEDPSTAYHILSSTSGVGTFSTVLLFLNILLTLYGWVMSLGYCSYSLSLARGQAPGMRSLFVGFGMVGKALLLYLLITLFSFLWSMAIFLPGTLLAMIFTYSLASVSEVAAILAGILTLLAACILWALITLRYALAPFALLDDPDCFPPEAIRRSKKLMRGQLGRFVTLHLSFLGWFLLLSFLFLLVAGFGMFSTALFTGFSLIQSAVATSDYYQLFDVMRSFYWGTLLSSLVACLVSAPLYLWLYPYLSCAQAKFYDFFSGRGSDASPMSSGDDPWSSSGPEVRF
jgi:uncharacterized membrane protein